MSESKAVFFCVTNHQHERRGSITLAAQTIEAAASEVASATVPEGCNLARIYRKGFMVREVSFVLKFRPRSAHA